MAWLSYIPQVLLGLLCVAAALVVDAVIALFWYD